MLRLAAPVLPPSSCNINNYLSWVLEAFKSFSPLQCKQQNNICATQSYTVSCVIPAQVQRPSQPLKDQSNSCNKNLFTPRLDCMVFMTKLPSGVRYLQQTSPTDRLISCQSKPAPVRAADTSVSQSTLKHRLFSSKCMF